MPPRIVIVGAGLSGLSLAFRLQQRMADAEIQVLESASRPGGTAFTIQKDGFTVELGPNGFLDSKPTTIGLEATKIFDALQGVPWAGGWSRANSAPYSGER